MPKNEFVDFKAVKSAVSMEQTLQQPREDLPRRLPEQERARQPQEQPGLSLGRRSGARGGGAAWERSDRAGEAEPCPEGRRQPSRVSGRKFFTPLRASGRDRSTDRRLVCRMMPVAPVAPCRQ